MNIVTLTHTVLHYRLHVAPSGELASYPGLPRTREGNSKFSRVRGRPGYEATGEHELHTLLAYTGDVFWGEGKKWDTYL